MGSGASPWAEHTARTRQALVDAALTLFAEAGYESTTTDQIAEAAGVSPRTFFRYFPTKEAVLFFGEYEFIRSFAAVYQSQPTGLPELEAVCASFVLLAPGIARLRERIKLYQRAVASSAVLRGREQANHESHASTIALAIAGRRELGRPDAASDVLAEVSVVVLQRAIDKWVAGPARADLARAITSEFALLAEVVRPSARSSIDS
jgi:AcrR family transcriptional regulator